MDYSQQNAAQLSLTDVVTAGSTTVTSATGGFNDTMIGNGFNIAGTVYCITGYTNTNTVTVDRAIGAASGQTGKVGGALASVGYCLSQTTVSNLVWVKAGTYSITSSSANVSAGRMNEAQGGSAAARCRVRGYDAARGDNTGTKPILQASGISNCTLWTSSASNTTIENITFDGATLTGILGMDVQVNDVEINGCVVKRCKGGGVVTLGRVLWIGCLFDTVGLDGATYGVEVNAGVMFCGCTWSSCAHSVKGPASGEGSFVRCIFANQSNNADIVYLEGGGVGRGYRFAECTFYTCPGDGISAAGNMSDSIVNCLFVGISGTAIKSTAGDALDVFNNAFYGNGTNTSGLTREVGSVTLSANPFVNAGAGNFGLNATAGGGAACRAAAYPGAFPGLASTVNYMDIGAVQHQDSAAGGVYVPNVLVARGPVYVG